MSDDNRKNFKLTGMLVVLLIGVVIAAGIVKDTQKSTFTQSLDVADSNTFTVLNSTAVQFSDAIFNGCSDVNIYNESNAANVTGSFTVSGCLATLTDNSINNTSPTVNYTGTDEDGTITSSVGFSLMTILEYIGFAAIIFLVVNKYVS